MLPARYVRGLLALSSHFLHISDYFSINYSDSSHSTMRKSFFLKLSIFLTISIDHVEPIKIFGTFETE
jgi:hypothetical protein